MSDIELVIKIPEKDWEFIKAADGCRWSRAILEGVINGTPLPKGHGRLIDKDHMIARLEAASKFFGGENADAFDERFSYGLKEAAIKVAEEPTIIEADKQTPSYLWKCERCGKLIPYMADFCHECAYKLLGEPPKPFELKKSEEE